jgi:hypothetical protein
MRNAKPRTSNLSFDCKLNTLYGVPYFVCNSINNQSARKVKYISISYLSTWLDEFHISLYRSLISSSLFSSSRTKAFSDKRMPSSTKAPPADEAALFFKADQKDSLDRVVYWNNIYGKTDPTTAGKAGTALAFVLPYSLYNFAPLQAFLEALSSMEVEDTPLSRIAILFSLQLIPASVFAFYVMFTGLTRIPSSPAAAHDPAALYATGQMPSQVHAANRAMINTLEQYALLISVSLALVLHIPMDKIHLLPAWYITWGISRIIYAFGYVHWASGRMLGFPATVLPTTAAFGYTLYLMFSQ